MATKAPPGVRFLQRFVKKDFSVGAHRLAVLVVTFITYALYHASRKPSSMVKSVLDPEGSESLGFRRFSEGSHAVWTRHVGFELDDAWYRSGGGKGNFSVVRPPLFRQTPRKMLLQNGSSSPNLDARALDAGWAPFNGKDGKVKLGEIDVGFLACYSLGMYFAGQIGDRSDLRLFLTAGMVGSGFFVCMFGLGYWLEIHSFAYYLVMQMLAGLFQSTGWPSVVTVVANWFGKSKRGLIMGIWNAHTSVGNIAGSLIAAAVLGNGWGWAFMVPGFMMIAGGGIVFLFLVVEPSFVDFSSPYGELQDQDSEAPGVTPSQAEESSSLLSNGTPSSHSKAVEYSHAEATTLQSSTDPEPRNNRAVGFLEAWKIPGVAPFAFCLFFAKLVAYTFLYWLPFYLKNTEIAGRYLNDQDSGNLSTLYDVGGVVGGILAGVISDKLKGRALTAATFMYLAIPALFLFRSYGHVSIYFSVGLMMLMGMLINGPYALITTAVSADLGTHESLKGNSRALSTVTAIIDGTGSVGAAVGPLLTGFVSQTGWDGVFYMLMLSAFISALLLTRLVIAEVSEKFRRVSILQDDITGTITERLLSMKE